MFMVLELNDSERKIVKRALEVLDEELKTVRVKMDKKGDKVELREEEHEIEELLAKVA